MPNFRLALRTLFKSPFVTLVAILSLALGDQKPFTFGFSLVDTLNWRNLS